MQRVSVQGNWTHANVEGRFFPRELVQITGTDLRVIAPRISWVRSAECSAQLADLIRTWDAAGYRIAAQVLKEIDPERLGTFVVEGEEIIDRTVAACAFYNVTV